MTLKTPRNQPFLSYTIIWVNFSMWEICILRKKCGVSYTVHWWKANISDWSHNDRHVSCLVLPEAETMNNYALAVEKFDLKCIKMWFCQLLWMVTVWFFRLVAVCFFFCTLVSCTWFEKEISFGVCLIRWRISDTAFPGLLLVSKILSRKKKQKGKKSMCLN